MRIIIRMNFIKPPTPLSRKIPQRSTPTSSKGVHPSESRGVSASARTIVCEKIRYPFNFYVDQIVKLKLLRKNALIRDENFSMSAFVRQALDRAFDKLERTGVP